MKASSNNSAKPSDNGTKQSLLVKLLTML